MTEKIDINPYILILPSTQTAVATNILKSGIDNNPHGCAYLFLVNIYYAPQLLAMMKRSWNIRGAGAYKTNRKGFDSDELKLDKNSERGSFVRLCYRRLAMIITRWKDSMILRILSTVLKKGASNIQRRVGEKIDVSCP